MTSVLIVDDERAVRDLMARWVASLGLRAETAASAEEALTTLKTRHYDLAVIDVMMPGHDGLWLTEQLRRDYPHTAVVIATGYADRVDERTRQDPIADFLVKPFPRERFAEAIDRGRQWRSQALDDLLEHARLSLELSGRVTAIGDAIRTLTATGATEAAALAAIVHERAADLVPHSARVARYAAAVARELRLDARTRETLDRAARFHDVGKAAMPRALLAKPSPLTAGERAIMRRHPDVGANILAATATLADAAPIVRSSHEWFGGGGYPSRLAGTAIPLASRIIAVMDAYDAMVETRAYRAALAPERAIAEIELNTPSQFDPEVVAAFLAVRRRQ